VRDCEQERDWAQLVFEQHATVPLSRVTALALVFPALRMAYGADIDGRQLEPAERAMFAQFGAGLQGAALGEYAAGDDKARETRIREQLRQEFTDQPHLRQLGNGMVSAAWVNPPKPGRETSGGVVTPVPNLSPAGPFQNTGEGALPGARP
jgi:hypothetical protein